MEPICILALEEIPNIGRETIKKILSISPTFEPHDPSDLISIVKIAKAKFGRISVPGLEVAKEGWNKAHEILELSQQNNIQIISRESPHYPKYLLRIPDPPALLHVKGNIDALNKDCIAIVGTREPTEYGIAAAKKLGELFAKEGYVIVSGLAEGIDAAAHRGALDVNGITVAVLAHGLDTIYPSKNKELADAILKNNGALVSEYPWGTKANRSYFIARDRIQSGLSLGVFVVETGIKGGTMYTVEFCKKQNRVLIVLQHSAEGNAKLISDKQADMVFENENDIELVKNKMKNKKMELLTSHLPMPSIEFIQPMHQDKKKNHHTNLIQMTLDYEK